MKRASAAFCTFSALLSSQTLSGCGASTRSDGEDSGASWGAADDSGPGGDDVSAQAEGEGAPEPASTGGQQGGDPGNGTGGGAPVASGGAQGADGGSSAAPPDPSSVDCRQDGDGATTLVFANGCSEPVEYRGSDIEGGVVAPGGFVCVDIGTDVEPLDSKRYWGFVGQDPGGEHHTLAEFTFNTDFYDFDWYNISHVDAHNLPMQIAPVARPDCDPVTCEESWLASCPEVGKLRNDGDEVIACVSPERDDSQSEVALFFEACDDAYAWSGDDQHGDDPSPMHACAGEDWDIVFCPEAE